MHGEWVTPTICSRRGDTNISDAEGGWKNHSWSLIAEMSEFDLFWMCFPDNYIWEVVVPMTNRYIDGPNMTLQDFYVWMCNHFFMAGFEGIEKKKMWWSEKTIKILRKGPSDFRSTCRGGGFRILEQLYATPILSRQPSLIGSTMCGR